MCVCDDKVTMSGRTTPTHLFTVVVYVSPALGPTPEQINVTVQITFIYRKSNQ